MMRLSNVLRRLHGDVVERATLARDILAPVASQLSGDPSNLHRRCVLGMCLAISLHSDGELHADLSSYGDIEAIACDYSSAVIVFRAAESAAEAVQRLAESPFLYRAVPPLEFALPHRCIEPQSIKVDLYPPSSQPNPTGGVVPTSSQAEGSSTEEATKMVAHDTQWTSRPVVVFLKSPAPTPKTNQPGITRFVLSFRSQVLGPKLGEDGHLWVEGHNITKDEMATSTQQARMRVVQVDPPIPHPNPKLQFACYSYINP